MGGGAEDRYIPSARENRGRPPPREGAPLYAAGGPTGAPRFPRGEVIENAGGSGNNFLIHSLSQILDAAECGDRRPASRGKCVYVRHPLVGKYGCALRAGLELEVWRRLFGEELGGRPIEWRDLCWSGFGGESAECVGACERCARLFHTVAPHTPHRPLRAHLASNWRTFRDAARISHRIPDYYRGRRGGGGYPRRRQRDIWRKEGEARAPAGAYRGVRGAEGCASGVAARNFSPLTPGRRAGD